MRDVVATCWVASAALFGVAGFLSNPGYYGWALVTLVFLAIAYSKLVVRRNKQLLLVGYVATAAYSFLVGRLLFGNGQLTNVGAFAILVITPVIGYLSWHLYKVEATAA